MSRQQGSGSTAVGYPLPGRSSTTWTQNEDAKFNENGCLDRFLGI
ncbi:hypothetical protein SCARD494_01414 [Seiridium cardinale]